MLDTVETPGVFRSDRDPRQRDFEMWEFSTYVVRRWGVFVISVAVATVSVLVASFFLPKKYTASASILIEPPAGNDPRGSMAVSPVYLESLKTYEHFASSDTLFASAVQQLKLRRVYGGVPLETLKRSVLEVLKPRDTKVLEIRATLKDPMLAQRLAHYIATATVEMNRSLNRNSTSELTEGGDQVLAAVRKRLQGAKMAREQALLTEPVAELEAEVAAGSQLKDHLLSELSLARTELAAYESRSPSGKQGPAYVDTEAAREAVTATRAQAASLSNQLQGLQSDLSKRTALLEIRKQHREMLDKDLAVAQQQFDAATNQRNEILESVAFRGERLEIIDPGVVPEKSSSPNVPLNVAVAATASVTGCFFYLALTFARRKRSMHFGCSV